MAQRSKLFHACLLFFSAWQNIFTHCCWYWILQQIPVNFLQNLQEFHRYLRSSFLIKDNFIEVFEKFVKSIIEFIEHLSGFVGQLHTNWKFEIFKIIVWRNLEIFVKYGRIFEIFRWKDKCLGQKHVEILENLILFSKTLIHFKILNFVPTRRLPPRLPAGRVIAFN